MAVIPGITQIGIVDSGIPGRVISEFHYSEWGRWLMVVVGREIPGKMERVVRSKVIQMFLDQDQPHGISTC